MSKTIIEVKCTDQVLTLTNTPVIASGGVGEDFVSVEFCPMWDDYSPALLFWRKGVDPIPVLEDDDGLFPVPAELTGVDGVVYFGAVGYDTDGNRRTSQAISYRLEAGAITEGTELPAPSGDVFDQIMAHYADVKLYVATRIDEASDAALAAGANARAAQSNAESAAGYAEEAAGYAADAVNAVDGVIYPGIVRAVKNEGNNQMRVFLDVCPPEKMLLTIQAPALADLEGNGYDSIGIGSITVAYPGKDGVEQEELFFVEEGYGRQMTSEAIGLGDVVTVLLARTGRGRRCYLLNPRITNTVLDKMGRQIYPGVPSSETRSGVMAIALDYEPEDRFFLVFFADAASSYVNKFVLDYESYEDGPVQVEYTLCDANNSPVESYGFYAGDYVLLLLTPSDKRATVLNPRVTRDTLNMVQEVVGMMPGGGCEVVSYVGDGSGSVTLNFSEPPELIHIESLGTGGYTVSATLFCDAMMSKVRVFSDGECSEYVRNYYGSWGKTVQVRFSDSHIPVGQLNANGVSYVAIGIM